MSQVSLCITETLYLNTLLCGVVDGPAPSTAPRQHQRTGAIRAWSCGERPVCSRDKFPLSAVGRARGRETRNWHPVALAAARCGDGQRPLGIQERILGGGVVIKLCHRPRPPTTSNTGTRHQPSCAAVLPEGQPPRNTVQAREDYLRKERLAARQPQRQRSVDR